MTFSLTPSSWILNSLITNLLPCWWLLLATTTFSQNLVVKWRRLPRFYNQNDATWRALTVGFVMSITKYHESHYVGVLDKYVEEAWTQNTSSSDQFVNPSTHKSDQCLISPYRNTPESNIKVVRKNDMINKWKRAGYKNQFSSSVPQKKYEE